MTFKDIRRGYQVYMLDRTDGLKAYVGKVTMVGSPRFQQPQNGVLPDYTKVAQTVVDVTIEANGQTRTYEIPEASSTVNAGKLTIGADKDCILRELRVIKAEADDALARVETHKATVVSCDAIMAEWDTSFAERKAQDERISSLESEVRGIGSMLKDFINEFKK